MLTSGEVCEEFRSLYGLSPKVVASAPGRLDMLNTHQDYKGLPVIGLAINLRCYVAVSMSGSGESRVASVNLKSEGMEWIDDFNSENPSLGPKGWFGNYVRASVKALRDVGIRVPQFNALIHSEVPVAAGLSSSAALTLSIIKALSLLAGQDLSPQEVAELAFRAEYDIMGIPCGRLDQYTSALGGFVLVRTRPPYGGERLRGAGGHYVVSVTPVRHSTASVHPTRQSEIDKALELILSMNPPKELRAKLGRRFWQPRWEELSEDELEPYLSKLPLRLKARLMYTLRAHESTLLAIKALRGGNVRIEEACRVYGMGNVVRIAKSLGIQPGDYLPPIAVLAAAMNHQHELLRDLYEVSVGEVEAVRDACLRSGALASKLSGAGMGGAVISLCHTESVAKDVVRASLALGRRICRLSMRVEAGEGVKGELIR